MCNRPPTRTHTHTCTQTHTAPPHAHTHMHANTYKQIHANCRLRRVFFADRQYAEEELPPEFRLFQRVDGKDKQRCVRWY